MLILLSPVYILFCRPSFEGYFASRSGAIALQTGNSVLKTTADKIGTKIKGNWILCLVHLLFA